VAVVAIGWAVAVFVVTAGHGVGISPDSIDYLTTAKNLSTFSGAVTWDGRALVDYPPGYPTLVAFVSRATTLNPQGAARLINIVIALLVTGLAAIVLRKLVTHEIVVLAGTVALVLSPSLVLVSFVAWSEFTFVLLQLVFLLTLDRAVRTRDWKWVVAAGLVGAAGFLTRYVGVTMLACGAILFRGRQRGVYLAVSLAPPVAWLARNQLQSGTLFGHRRGSRYSAPHVAGQLFVELRRWLLPDHWPTLPQLAFTAIAVLAVGFLYKNRAHWTARATRPPLFDAVILLGAGHVLLLGASAVRNIDNVDQRLLTPLAVPFIVVVAVLADRHLDAMGRVLGRRRGLAVAGIGLLLFVTGPLALDMNVVSEIHKHGYIYASDHWQQSAGMKLVAQLPSTAIVYSNHYDGMFWVTGRHGRLPPETDQEVAAMVRAARDQPSYVLWFDDPANPYILTPTELAQRAELATVTRTDDATLYAVVSRASPS
jgi:4-amino-4-deoxy-L-arabinose transferase-like glycosyltransferase